MKSYRLLMPDGTPSDVWACGECNRPRIAVIGTGAAASDSSRERADACCVPRTCGFCGKPTERNAVGDYPPYHDACLEEARRPDLSHPSMRNPWARLLFRRMSELSEQGYFAGWVMGNEFLLWSALEDSTAGYGDGCLSPEEIEELHALADRVNGWIWTGPVDEHVPRLVSRPEWDAIRAARSSNGE